MRRWASWHQKGGMEFAAEIDQDPLGAAMGRGSRKQSSRIRGLGDSPWVRVIDKGVRNCRSWVQPGGVVDRSF